MNTSHVGRYRDRCGLCAGLVGRRQRIPVYLRAPVCRGAGQQTGDRDHQDAAPGVPQRHRHPPQAGAGRAQDPGDRGREAALGAWSATSLAAAAASKIATAAGAVAGGCAGNQVQGNMRAGDTYTTTGAALQDGAGEQHPHPGL